VVHEHYIEMLTPAATARGMRVIPLSTLQEDEVKVLPQISQDRRAMILYTSGTTSKPKGVVSTHANISSQVSCLIDAWGWTKEDQILHVLPLHHTHGIINVLLCALWAGATCRMLSGFDAARVWHAFRTFPLTLFMAVPTIYAKLIQYWDHAPASERVQLSVACQKFRLMVSGSAALPISVLKKWEMVSRQRLLERYGMTEIGMALSNPLHEERRPGTVGHPLPGVELQLVDDGGQVVERDGVSGEVQIKGPNVFLEYWRKPEATQEAFQDGWFLTGDIGVKENGYFRLLGRNSVDIIKTGGYKVSALEIEEVLRTHPSIAECAVIGMPDEEWGERVCAGIVLQEKAALVDAELKTWAKERLAPYKVPTRIAVLEDLPRNVMGKVTKPALRAVFAE
ncbi:MAG: acyl-CoA synthetase, partial [Rhodothermales bacterium]